MLKVVGDLEADGFVDFATRIWCGVFQNLETGELYIFTQNQMKEMTQFLDTCSDLIMHNGIDYDKPLMKKLLNYEYKGQIIDTYIMSQVDKPNRDGGHSVENWGKILGVKKQEHSEWDKFSWRMVNRCAKDTLIQTLIFKKLYSNLRGIND